ncbi:Outer membrane protein TolC [Solitalea koreensis]|uniref:Outer membrane protein TolC n=2 Tax=Solitalea koreensis TaxID=543615 RepID=A0A521AM84_9SPHI|nr:Outer membrane protein TolC [Solitalea koreensis]
MKKLSLAVIVLFSIYCKRTSAQYTEVLSLEKATEIALKNNYSIEIARNNSLIDKNNATRANAGMLPRVDATAGTVRNINDTKTTFFNGTEQNKNGAHSNSYNANVGLTWTIFDGMQMFATYDKLKQVDALGETNAKITVLTTMYDITTIYYDIVRKQREINTFKEALDISRMRVKNAANKYYVGSGSKLDLLASKVDLNADTTNLIRLEQDLKATKINLNNLLAREVTIDFTAQDTIPIDKSLTYEETRNRIMSQNPQLTAAYLNQNISKFGLKEIKANRYPTVSLNSNYSFLKSQSEVGQTLSNRNLGFNYGATASINIFNGLLQHRQEKNAAFNIKNAELFYQQVKQQLDASLNNAYNNYVNSIVLIGLEEENKEVAKQNLEITVEKYKLGNITALDLRDAQQNYLQADFRYTNAQYEAKLAEIGLKLLYGSLY